MTRQQILSADILDGTIATADLANGSVTNAKLAADTARANLLVNGGFELWQRGGGPFAAGYIADRWVIGTNGGDAFSVSASGNYDTVNNGSALSAAVAFTLSGGAGGSVVQQKLEHTILRGKTLSFSIRIQTNVASAVRAAIYDGSAWQYSSFHTGNNAWQTLTITATMQAAPTALYVAVFFAASGTHYLDNAMLVFGSVPADYVPLLSADDLARCLRYYQRWQPGASQDFALIQGVQASIFGSMALQGRMGGTPTCTTTAVTDFQIAIYGLGNYVCNAVNLAVAQGIFGLVNASTGTTWGGTRETAHLQAVNANATLMAEWNP